MWTKLNKLREIYLQKGIMNSIDYEKSCMISIVWNSSKIEGCSLSEADTRVLIENNITAKGKPLTDHLMVKDHYEAFLFIKEAANSKRRITTDFIKEINSKVMKSTGGKISSITGDFDTSQGDLRLTQVYVDSKYFPDFRKVPDLLNQLCSNTNERIDQVSGDEIIRLSADIHNNFVNIHPFGDGNGRTARLLMNYIQLYHNEPLIKIFSEDRAAYINALNDTEKNGDIAIFHDFICQQQVKFYEAELNKYEKSIGAFNLDKNEL